MAIAVILALCALYLLSASLVLMGALRKEHELKFRHWLRSMSIFIVIRFVAIVFQSTVNVRKLSSSIQSNFFISFQDLYFAYHQAMLIIWFLLTMVNIFVWLVVYSNYQELSDITRLEDMAKLKMSTLSSLNASRSFSHHSLDSANPYGRYGGSLQPSPQIFHHTQQPMSIHESHQNILPTGVVSVGNTPQIQPKSLHSSQNSLHASYLQMYSNTLSQRSRQSSATSLSMNSMPNAYPMTAYGHNSQYGALGRPSNAPV